MERRCGNDIVGQPELEAGFQVFPFTGPSSRVGFPSVNSHSKCSLTELFTLRVKSVLKCMPIHIKLPGYHFTTTVGKESKDNPEDRCNYSSCTQHSKLSCQKRISFDNNITLQSVVQGRSDKRYISFELSPCID